MEDNWFLPPSPKTMARILQFLLLRQWRANYSNYFSIFRGCFSRAQHLLFKLLQTAERGITSLRTGHREICSPNELLLHFSFPEERLESPKKSFEMWIKGFNSAQLPPWQGWLLWAGDGNAEFLPLSCQSPTTELVSLQKYQIISHGSKSRMRKHHLGSSIPCCFIPSLAGAAGKLWVITKQEPFHYYCY